MPTEPATGSEASTALSPRPETATRSATVHPRPRPRPEILAPAGDFECVRAAVENGADAVYFGVQKWNARARAKNFPVEELPELLSFLHLRGVKGYVTFNTLLFSNELAEGEALLERILAAGPDALILQDFGVARLARAISPDVHLHASTQTTTTCPEQMESLRELGFSRVILARELSVADIRRIKASTDMPLEVFVHGALCVAYSGQCLTSEAIGGRSANRGACAQACRFPYELHVDGRRHDLGEKQYLISPQDLAAYDLVPELLELVVSLKIEGRLKAPEYVAATTRAYRKAVDGATAAAVAAASTATAAPAPGGQPLLTRDEVLGLEQVFSRGLSHGFLGGVNHQVLVPALSPKKRGLFLGHVTGVLGSRVAVKLEGPLKPGDGVVFDYGRPQDDEPGGRVLHVWKDGRRVEAADAPDAVEFEVRECPPPRAGWRLWKTDDPALDRALRATFERTGARVPVDALVEEAAGALKVTFTDGTHRVTGEAGPLQVAERRPLTEDYLREQLGRLGDTPFVLRGLEARLGRVILPVSRLNDLRRRLTAELVRLRRANPGYRIQGGALARLRVAAQFPAPKKKSADPPPRLAVLCRSMDQVEAALAEGATWIECDYEDPRRYRDAAERVHAAGAVLCLAPPRILKPGEQGFLKLLLGAGPDAVLARSTGHLPWFRREAPGVPLVGDFSLNAANDLTADWLLAQGLLRFVPSYDLNFEQLAALFARTDASRAEVVVHQYMPMFHMEHCVFAACLSTGKDYTDCGRPCDRHDLALKDWSGRAHPVKADAGCRNTIYNAVPQSASQYVRRFLDLGVRWFRLELLRETGDEARRLVRGYADVLAGRSDGQTLWQELRASNYLGVTRGPLGRED
ncbi:MAG: U32 family peptidase [Planctomycetes bacterium]|nr:U32 family peptidase [Planctomycetota bacterium]